jgi:penicillin-binding protein 1C
MAKPLDFAGDLIRKDYRKRRKKVYVFTFGLFLVWYITALPSQLFHDSTSTVLLDRNGQLLGARIANDGQWRFQESDSIPYRFATCLIAFEDRNFYGHIGVSGKGLFRAFTQNISSGKRKSGGSTLTMQLVRLMRKNPPRTYSEKLLEIVLATRIELTYSKAEILRLHASHAPFGNNVVGLEAASWRYFNRPPHQLSWAESAVLAVLPNAPGLIYPGRNQTALLAKRNRLLKHLCEAGYFDKTTLNLALEELLPNKPLPLPHHAPHFLDRCIREGKKGQTINSTIDLTTQKNAIRQLSAHSSNLEEKMIFNGAVIITDVHTGELLAYVGNTNREEAEHASWVDCASSPRSSGSILKPLLYAACLEKGDITPEMLLSDIPSSFGSFSPKNFSGQFEGAVPASTALSRSLNIPMVHLLNEYGVKNFHNDLQQLGITSIRKSASHYGLSLILGGAEVRLDEMTGVYLQLAQQLNNEKLTGIQSDLAHSNTQFPKKRWSNTALFHAFEALQEVNRPDEDNNWKLFSSSRKIAWKTGTSFGFRDAWAIGVTPDHIVSVWIGNADGEGRPGLTGVKAAAPLLFDLFRQLTEKSSWFNEPFTDRQLVHVCKQSGYPAGPYCSQKKTSFLPQAAHLQTLCPYHKLVHLDVTGTYRVDSECENTFNMKKEKWFVLPAIMERFYQLKHPDYRFLPEFRGDCQQGNEEQSMAFIYPKNNAIIYVPIELDGSEGRTIFELSYRRGSRRIFWHLDNQYIGETMEIHQLLFKPSRGKHQLTAIDEDGQKRTVKFTVVGKR